MSHPNRKYLIFAFIILLTVISAIFVGYSTYNGDASAEMIYVSEGRSILEVDANEFQINRTINTTGTTVEMTYDNVSGYLYATIGATNKLYEIDTDEFTINREFSGHTFNVQDALPDDEVDGYIYTTASDNTVRKINYTNFTEEGIYESHNASVMDAELKNGYIYSGTFDFTISKVETDDMSEVQRIKNFPAAVPAVGYDDRNETVFFGGSLGTIYKFEADEFNQYEQYSDIPEDNYRNIEFNKASDEINRSNVSDVEEYGMHKIVADSSRGYLYAGGARGNLYKVDMETLQVEDTYVIEENRKKDYNFSKYDSMTPEIENGSHKYNYDIRGIDMGPERDYIYITVAPGTLIEIDADTFEENRRLRTTVVGRTVSLAVK